MPVIFIRDLVIVSKRGCALSLFERFKLISSAVCGTNWKQEKTQFPDDTMYTLKAFVDINVLNSR